MGAPQRVYSDSFRESDAVALFATHVGSALEVAEYIEALERAQKELVERERLAALGELSAIIAHEIRNPLGAMFASVGGLQRILCEEPDFARRDDATTLLGIVDEEAHRLESIVSDLLDFARPASLRLDRASLADVLSDVASCATSRPEAQAVELEVDVEPDLPPIPLPSGGA